MLMALDSRPALTRKARLRFDRTSGEYLLLSPERGLILNGPASAIVQLCTGTNTLEAMIDRLVQMYPDSPRASLAEDLSNFLSELEGRGLLRETGS
jgi:coenzyme PQQ biosynthesis protein PqqD